MTNSSRDIILFNPTNLINCFNLAILLNKLTLIYISIKCHAVNSNILIKKLPTEKRVRYFHIFPYWLGIYTKNLSDAFETVPHRITATGAYISHNLTTHHRYDTEELHFNVSIYNIDHHLVLAPSHHFLAPAIVIERRKSDAHSRYRPTHKSSACHFQGVVRGQPNSRVAISTCNGLVSCERILCKQQLYERVFCRRPA